MLQYVYLYVIYVCMFLQAYLPEDEFDKRRHKRSAADSEPPSPTLDGNKESGTTNRSGDDGTGRGSAVVSADGQGGSSSTIASIRTAIETKREKVRQEAWNLWLKTATVFSVSDTSNERQGMDDDSSASGKHPTGMSTGNKSSSTVAAVAPDGAVGREGTTPTDTTERSLQSDAHGGFVMVKNVSDQSNDLASRNADISDKTLHMSTPITLKRTVLRKRVPRSHTSSRPLSSSVASAFGTLSEDIVEEGMDDVIPMETVGRSACDTQSDKLSALPTKKRPYSDVTSCDQIDGDGGATSGAADAAAPAVDDGDDDDADDSNSGGDKKRFRALETGVMGSWQWSSPAEDGSNTGPGPLEFEDMDSTETTKGEHTMHLLGLPRMLSFQPAIDHLADSLAVRDVLSDIVKDEHNIMAYRAVLQCGVDMRFHSSSTCENMEIEAVDRGSSLATVSQSRCESSNLIVVKYNTSSGVSLFRLLVPLVSSDSEGEEEEVGEAEESECDASSSGDSKEPPQGNTIPDDSSRKDKATSRGEEGQRGNPINVDNEGPSLTQQSTRTDDNDSTISVPTVSTSDTHTAASSEKTTTCDTQEEENSPPASTDSKPVHPSNGMGGGANGSTNTSGVDDLRTSTPVLTASACATPIEERSRTPTPVEGVGGGSTSAPVCAMPSATGGGAVSTAESGSLPTGEAQAVATFAAGISTTAANASTATATAATTGHMLLQPPPSGSVFDTTTLARPSLPLVPSAGQYSSMYSQQQLLLSHMAGSAPTTHTHGMSNGSILPGAQSRPHTQGVSQPNAHVSDSSLHGLTATLEGSRAHPIRLLQTHVGSSTTGGPSATTNPSSQPTSATTTSIHQTAQQSVRARQQAYAHQIMKQNMARDARVRSIVRYAWNVQQSRKRQIAATQYLVGSIRRASDENHTDGEGELNQSDGENARTTNRKRIASVKALVLNPPGKVWDASCVVEHFSGRCVDITYRCGASQGKIDNGLESQQFFPDLHSIKFRITPLMPSRRLPGKSDIPYAGNLWGMLHSLHACRQYTEREVRRNDMSRVVCGGGQWSSDILMNDSDTPEKSPFALSLRSIEDTFGYDASQGTGPRHANERVYSLSARLPAHDDMSNKRYVSAHKSTCPPPVVIVKETMHMIGRGVLVSQEKQEVILTMTSMEGTGDETEKRYMQCFVLVDLRGHPIKLDISIT